MRETSSSHIPLRNGDLSNTVNGLLRLENATEINYSENDRQRDKFYADFHDTENLKMHQNNVYGSTIITAKSSYHCKVGSSSGRRMTLSDDVVDNSVEKEDEGNSSQIQIQTEDFLKVSGLS